MSTKVEKLLASLSEDDQAALRRALSPAGKITYKVSPKGGMSAYGLQQWPVTLYVEQWRRFDSPEEVQRRRDFVKRATDDPEGWARDRAAAAEKSDKRRAEKDEKDTKRKAG